MKVESVKTILTAFLFLFFTGCKQASIETPVFLAQGSMTGEITSTSAILQTRLTASPGSIDRDVPGKTGLVKFIIDTTANFVNPFKTRWISAQPGNDFIVKLRLDYLFPDTRHYFKVEYTCDTVNVYQSTVCSFKTLPGKENETEVSFVVVTGMNYAKFHYGTGNYDQPDEKAYQGSDKYLGFPALEVIAALNPDFMVATGDNVYYDSPKNEPWVANTQIEMRQKWHEQFVQPRFIDLFSRVPVYWEKDDHDFRFNDCDTTGIKEPGQLLGRAVFLEQIPLALNSNQNIKTYRTFRINKHLQIWLMEGRDFRSPNTMNDGPEKTLWGKEQIAWLKETIQSSDAMYKLIISPTPLIGPDDAYKKDNHTNPGGFQHERDKLFKWFISEDLLQQNIIFICGDRHWQYHSIHPDGFEEFSCGALVDANAREGRLPGDPGSTDPEGKIDQPYVQGPGKASGGFLNIRVKNESEGSVLSLIFLDEKGKVLYSHQKVSKGVVY